jgi:diguanylate cyclase (GGDEF)-like protein
LLQTIRESSDKVNDYSIISLVPEGLDDLKKVFEIIPDKKPISEKELSTASLFKRVKIVTVVAFILINIFIIFVVYRPMADTLKKDQIQVFSLVAHLDFHILESALMRGVEAANALSSRTMIRNAIGDYKEGIIDFTGLQTYTEQKYADGARTVEYLVSAYRCVDGKEVTGYISEGYDSESVKDILKCHLEDKASETAVFIKKEELEIMASIVSPVYIDDTIVGYDFILYSLSDQLEKINSESLCLDIISEETYYELLEQSQLISEDTEMTTIKKDDVYYTLGNINDMIYIMVYETQATLFKNIMGQTNVIIVFGIVFFMLFVVVFYFFIIRYINSGLGRLENSRDVFKHIAYEDALTKAYSRSFLTVWNEKIRKPDQTYSIILIDVNRFKTINDAFGHLTGDHVLSEISRIFRENIRSNDYFFRFGGDEFVLFLEAFPAEKLNEKIESVIKKIKNIELPKGTVSISYGMSHLGPKENLEEKINLADRKMYEQKMKRKG